MRCTLADMGTPLDDIRVSDVSHAVAEPYAAQSPCRFSSADSGVAGPTARRGEDNSEVLSDWLGLSEIEVAKLPGLYVLESEAVVEL